MLEQINALIWGFPVLALILGVGIYLSVKTRLIQLRMLPDALIAFFRKMKPSEQSKQGVSSFQALCTALAATVGTGNIAGVAGAIILGGPGAVFWMWISALLGMVIKFAEAILCICFRRQDSNGQCYGGPMYMISNALPQKWRFLATIYAFFGVIAAFGVGNATQINACLIGVKQAASLMGRNMNSVTAFCIAVAIAIMIAVILLGGAVRVGRISQLIVPVAAAGYILLCFGVLCIRHQYLPNAIGSIISGAFSPRAITGGVISSLLTTMRIGVSRGMFTNEAGMGTAGIAHAGAVVSHPVEQGLMGIVEVFLDTVVICTMTALVILCSGVSIPYGNDIGALLTNLAFSSVYGQWVTVPIALFLFSFAFATMIGWGLYGIRCAQFLFGSHAAPLFVILQCIITMLSVCLKTQTVWLLADIVNGLMAIPNLVAVLMLTPKLLEQIHYYKKCLGSMIAHGGTYENFDQCKPL